MHESVMLMMMMMFLMLHLHLHSQVLLLLQFAHPGTEFVLPEHSLNARLLYVVLVAFFELFVTGVVLRDLSQLLLPVEFCLVALGGI
jgi:hypothetical protein